MQNLKSLLAILTTLVFFACDSGPKVIDSVPIDSSSEPANYENAAVLVNDADPHQHLHAEAEHKVTVNESLHTERYTYLNVTEDEAAFWIAIPKKEVETGATYYYRGGLLKRNFYSREFDRTFDELYLVSDVIPHSLSGGSVIGQAPAQNSLPASGEVMAVKPTAGAIKIADLLDNRSQYDGRLVKVTGKCVKVNPMIMGRNWVHLQDGPDDEYDLTVTTQESIPLGAVVSLEGTIALNKDFGAGYRYEVIMEGARLK